MKKIGIVTGASSGMGVSFALGLAKECIEGKELLDELWLIARREDKLRDTKKAVEMLSGAENASCSPENASGGPANASRTAEKLCPAVRIIPMDISGQEGAKKFKALLDAESESTKASGGIFIQVLVNNAGFGTYGEFISTDTEREMEMVDLNCTSLTGLTGYALPFMGRGTRLINTASLASFIPLGNFAVYGATKAYVLSLTVALAAELKDRGIKVTALCPGPVSTEFANVASKGARKEVRHGLSPEKTVAHCLKASRKGKLYSMYAFKWRFKAAASRFIGRYLGAWYTYRFCKRPSN